MLMCPILTKKGEIFMGKDLKGKDLGKGFSQRKDGRYEARATINGKKIHLYDMNLATLKKEFEQTKAKVLRKEEGTNLTLLEWYENWFQTCKRPQLKSQACAVKYDRKVRNTFINILGEKKLSNITHINIQTAVNELIEEKGYTYRTTKEALAVLRECFEIAMVNRFIPSNPCIGINIQHINTVQKEKRVLTHEEQKRFLDEVRGSYYYEAYALLLLTGMRIGEFAGLQWQDIDFKNKEINIHRSMSTTYIDGKKIEELTTPKTANSNRSIPFFADTEEYLKAWKKKQDTYKKKLGDRWRAKDYGDLVFTSTTGSPVTRYVLSHDLQKVTNNINMKELYLASKEGREPIEFKNVHPHAFRHTFATRCFEKGMDPLFVQSIMGHSNYATTVSYTHVLDNIKQREAAKASNFLG